MCAVPRYHGYIHASSRVHPVQQSRDGDTLLLTTTSVILVAQTMAATVGSHSKCLILMAEYTNSVSPGTSHLTESQTQTYQDNGSP